MLDNIIRKLENGLKIKGSFTLHLNGCYFDLYITNNTGSILASKHFLIKMQPADPQAILIENLLKIETTAKKYKVDKLTEISSLEKACPLVMLKAFPIFS